MSFRNVMASKVFCTLGTQALSEEQMSHRKWFAIGAGAVLSLALAATPAVAQGNGHGHEKHDRDDDHDDHGHGKGHEKHRDRYSEHDRDAARDWYRAHYSHLPPGLAKRDHLPPGLERQLVVNGTLPPGLQKKIQPCPRELEAMFPPPPPNYAHVVIGGNVVLVNRVSFQVADVLHLDVDF
jgi:hypothetical protein